MFNGCNVSPSHMTWCKIPVEIYLETEYYDITDIDVDSVINDVWFIL